MSKTRKILGFILAGLALSTFAQNHKGFAKTIDVEAQKEKAENPVHSGGCCCTQCLKTPNRQESL